MLKQYPLLKIADLTAPFQLVFAVVAQFHVQKEKHPFVLPAKFGIQELAHSVLSSRGATATKSLCLLYKKRLPTMHDRPRNRAGQPQSIDQRRNSP